MLRVTMLMLIMRRMLRMGMVRVLMMNVDEDDEADAEDVEVLC